MSPAPPRARPSSRRTPTRWRISQRRTEIGRHENASAAPAKGAYAGVDEAAERAEHQDERHDVISCALLADPVLDQWRGIPAQLQIVADEIEADCDSQEENRSNVHQLARTRKWKRRR